MRLTGTGIWSAQLRFGDPAAVRDASAELEDLGYSALWIPDIGGDVFGSLRTMLDATTSIVAATGILNLWMHSAEDAAAGFADLSEQHPDRVLLGIGVSHAPLVDAGSPGRYRAPLDAMRSYLDGLDAATPPLPAGARVLAALGPRMLELARHRSAGAHPYLVNPAHTQLAREVVGKAALLAPEQAVVLETDPAAARALARGHLSIYLTLPNYTRNLRRIGFDDDDFAAGGSDRLVDAIVAWGDEDAVRARVQEHRDAGADHVAVQVITDDSSAMPLDACRRLAPALTA
jgi:probable F420-dependent oxidoreductase